MPAFPESLAAEHLFDAHIDLDPPQVIGETPFGPRSTFIVTRGVFEGPRLRGTVLPGGGDWFLTRSDGIGELDVRATLRTDDGALIHMDYRGILDASPDVIRRAFDGEDVALSEFYFRTTPRFQTGAQPYAWLNTIVCVGIGAFGANRVSYRLFRIL